MSEGDEQLERREQAEATAESLEAERREIAVAVAVDLERERRAAAATAAYKLERAQSGAAANVAVDLEREQRATAAAAAVKLDEHSYNATSTLARWQGTTDAHLRENSRRLDGINGSLLAMEHDLTAMKVDLATIKTRVAMWSGFGSLAGAGLVSVVVSIVSGGG